MSTYRRYHMADINQQTEELARIMEQVNREMAMYGQITKTTADQKRDAEIQAATGMKNFTKASGTAADAVGHLASAGMSAGKAMLEGKKGAAAFNESIDGMTKAATAAGIALTLLIPGGALIKGIVAGFTALTAATAGMVKASNEMADKLYKSYSGLAKSGAAASDGMTGVFNDAKKLGLSMNELDGFVGLVGENSKDLALFSGSVFEGRKRFADIGAAMEPYRKQMIAAGLTQEQINEGAMGYLKLQTQLGRSQNMTNKELADGARKYLVEMDGLSKMTGQSRKEMEDAMEAARSEQRFRAKLEEVRLTQGEDAAKRLEKANVIISSQSKEMGQAFRDISTGMLGTEAAQKGMMGTQGELMTSTQKLIAGQVDEFEAVTNIGKAAGQFAKDMNMTAQLGTFNDMATDYAGQLKLGIFAEKDKAEQAKLIAEDQKKQGLTGAKAADGITNQYAENIKQQQELNKKMEQTVFKGIDNALVITNKLGNATDTLATGFEVLGTAVNKLLNVLGLGVPERAVTKEEQEANKKADEAKKAFEESVKGAGMAARLFGIGLTDQQKQLKQQQKDAEENALMQKQRQDLGHKLEKQKKEGEKRRAERTGVTAPVGGKQELPAAAPAQSSAPAAAGGAAPAPAPAAAGGAAPAPAPAAAGGAAPAAPTEAAPASLPVGPAALEMPAGGGEPQKASYRDYIKFTGGTGSEEHFGKLKEPVMQAFVKMARDYNQLSGGKKLQVNSAYRSPEEQANVDSGTNPKAAPGMSLHNRGRAIDIQSEQVNFLKATGLLQNYRFKPLAGDPPHIFMRDGGIATGPDTGYPATLHGTEAVIPLKQGAVPVSLDMKNAMSPGGIGPTFAGMNEYTGYNQGPLTTDLDAIKDIAAKLGAYDASTKLITDPTTWKQILSSGIATNYDMGLAEIGTKMIPGIGADIGERIKELKDTGSGDTASALKQVTDELRTAMLEMVKNMGGGNNAQSGEQLMLLTELVREQRNANDINARILQVSSN
jgi:hypothetical protein